MKNWIQLCAAWFGLMVNFSVQSHQISTAYLTLDKTEEVIKGQYQVKLIDMAFQLNLDSDNNRSITWAEVKVAKPAIDQWLHSHLIFKKNTSQCGYARALELSMDSHFNEPYLRLDFILACDSKQLSELHYQGIFGLNSAHKLLVNVTDNNNQISRILTVENPVISLNQNNLSKWQTFKEYTQQGVIHILIGLDHIMFLLCLLLAAIIFKDKCSDRLNFKATTWNVLALVTVFTLAHSVTLVLTAMNWLAFPSRWVEIIIALTVAATALNNIWPFIRHLKTVTFLFGLIHGMGFAGVLGELGLPAEAKTWPIFAFNLGVELGQVMLIAVTLPILYYLNKSWARAQVGFRGVSGLILVLALYWVVERF